jgi:curli production assembly/transport component CsgF
MQHSSIESGQLIVEEVDYMRIRRRLLCRACLVFGIVAPSSAYGQEIIYRPINPAFGGNALNGAYLLATATAQDKNKDPDDALAGIGSEPDPNAQFKEFARQLQARLLTRLAAEATDAIFGSKPNESGSINFGSQIIEYRNTGTAIELTLRTDTGGTTTITIPLVQRGG